jgi:hypothetical protein
MREWARFSNWQGWKSLHIIIDSLRQFAGFQVQLC